MSYRTLSPQVLYNLLITACRSTAEEAAGQGAKPHSPSRAHGTAALGRGEQSTEPPSAATFRHTAITRVGNRQALQQLYITTIIGPLQLFTSAPFIT